jgi:hypothetical protein
MLLLPNSVSGFRGNNVYRLLWRKANGSASVLIFGFVKPDI